MNFHRLARPLRLAATSWANFIFQIGWHDQRYWLARGFIMGSLSLFVADLFPKVFPLLWNGCTLFEINIGIKK